MKKIQGILRHRRLATTEEYIADLAPLENVLEGVLGKGKRPDVIAEPFLEFTHEVTHACVVTQKLQ